MKIYTFVFFFFFKDILLKENTPTKCSSCKDDEPWLTADEDEDSECEPLVPLRRSLQELEEEKLKITNYKKRIRKKRIVTEEGSESESDETPNKNTVAVWSPIDKFEKPSHEAILRAMEKLHDLVVRPPPKFRFPKGIKAWLKGDYTPSKETIKNWKKVFIEHFGNQSMLDKVITPVMQNQYEELLNDYENDYGHDDNEGANFLLSFKKLLAENKREKERKEKAEEIISNVDSAKHKSYSSAYSERKEHSEAEEANLNQTTIVLQKVGDDRAKEVEKLTGDPPKPSITDNIEVFYLHH